MAICTLTKFDTAREGIIDAWGFCFLFFLFVIVLTPRLPQSRTNDFLLGTSAIVNKNVNSTYHFWTFHFQTSINLSIEDYYPALHISTATVEGIEL